MGWHRKYKLPETQRIGIIYLAVFWLMSVENTYEIADLLQNYGWSSEVKQSRKK